MSLTEVVVEGPDEARRFFAEVLGTDAELLPVLVAAGVEGLVAGVAGAAADLITIDSEQAAIEVNQRLFLEGGAFDSDTVFRALRSGATDAGIGNDDRWAALLGVLGTARSTGATTASFIVELDEPELDDLAPASDPPDVPEDDAAFSAAVEDALTDLLVDAVYAVPEARELLTGDGAIDRDAFAADPFVVSLIDFDRDGVGRASIAAISELLDPP